MNRIYRLIWKFSINAPQVASEQASSGGKGRGATCDQRQNAEGLSRVSSAGSRVAPFALKVVAVAIASMCLSTPAWAVIGGSVVPGAINGVCQEDNSGDVACGQGSEASGGSGMASGYKSHATGLSSTASGFQSTASGNGDIAMGGNATTTNSSGQTGGNIAIGSSPGVVHIGAPGTPTTANGGNSIAIGTGAQSTGNNSVALGCRIN